jgi:hypothetical protein
VCCRGEVFPAFRKLRRDVAYLLLIAAVVVGVAALALPRFGRNRRLEEVDRFHRAGEITSGWARAGVTQPVLVDDAAPRDETPDAPEPEHRDLAERAAAHN